RAFGAWTGRRPSLQSTDIRNGVLSDRLGVLWLFGRLERIEQIRISGEALEDAYDLAAAKPCAYQAAIGSRHFLLLLKESCAGCRPVFPPDPILNERCLIHIPIYVLYGSLSKFGSHTALPQILNHTRAAESAIGEPGCGKSFGEPFVVEIS